MTRIIWVQAGRHSAVRRMGLRTMGAVLLSTVAMPAAWASNECGQAVAGQARCTANGNPYKEGITYNPSGSLVLTTDGDVIATAPIQVAGGSGLLSVVNNGTVMNSVFQRDAITVYSNADAAISGSGAIINLTDYGDAARAVAGQTGGDATISVGNVSNAGALGVGLYAASVEGSASASGQTISTTGAIGTGILVQARANAAATFSSITTTGDNSAGVSAQATLGTIAVSGGTVTTSGNSSAGVDAEATTGAVSVAVTGPVATRGGNSAGVLATSGQGSVTVNVADVSTTGASSYAAYLSGRGASLVSTGTLSTTGTTGVPAVAALVNGGDGLASIQLANANTVGDGAEAALASSISGNAAIVATGAIRTAGMGARGLDAQAFGGRATIASSGSVATSGDFATGLMAGGGLGAAVTSTGSVTTTGANAAGIIVDSTYAPASVTAANVVTTGDSSVGVRIDATQSSATASVSSITTSGRASEGLFVLAPQGVAVTVGSSSTRGDFARAVFAEADAGPVTITSGNASVTGIGSTAIVALASGPIAVTSGAASSAASSAVFLQSNASTAALTVTGLTVSANADAVSVNATTAATLVVGTGGTITSGTNAVVISGTTTSVQNAGTISGGIGAAIAAFGGPATVLNTGTINGAVAFKDGADIVTNNATFNASGTSDFGGGADTFVNAGVLNAASASGNTPSLVTFANLEQFSNSGLISLANGRAGDQFVLSGNYVGQGSAALRLDVSSARATLVTDRLRVGGAATGLTQVQLASSGGSLALISTARSVLVDAAAGSSPTAFVLAPASSSFGFAQYTIVFDPDSDDYSLAVSPSGAAQRPLRLAEGARNIWYRVTDIWSARTRALRDGEDEAGQHLWGQSYGAVAHGGDGVAVAGGENLAYRQDIFGAELGYDVARALGPGGGRLLFGVMGGYASSYLALAASGARARYDSANAGLYAGAHAGIAFVNVLALYERHWVKLRDDQPAYTASVSGNAVGAAAEAGLRFGNDGLLIEPVATIAYVRSDVGGFAAESSQFGFPDSMGLRGKLGVRLNHTVDMGEGAHLLIYASGSAVKEFKGEDRLDFLNNGVDYAYATRSTRLYAEGVAGMRIASPGRLSGFIEATGDFAGGRSGLRGGGGRAGLQIAL